MTLRRATRSEGCGQSATNARLLEYRSSSSKGPTLPALLTEEGPWLVQGKERSRAGYAVKETRYWETKFSRVEPPGQEGS